MNRKLNYFFFIGALFLCLGTYAQEKTITGTVTSAADGMPLPGVNVLVQGTTNGTQTDFDGNYAIDATDSDILVFSYIGTKSQSVNIGDSSTIDVILVEDASQLEEVVVTALGLERQEKSLTYANQQVDTDELTKARSVNVLEGLSGKVAGVSVTRSSSGVGAPVKVVMRGNRSIDGSSQPLYVVDGILLDGDINNISPDDIQEISVLRGANAAALYGSRAANGAIIVTTKSGKGAREGVSATLGFASTITSAIHLLDFQNEYGQGSAGTYSPTATTSWGPRFDGSQVAHWSNDPNYSAFGGTYAYEAQPDNVKDFFQLGHELATNLGVNINSEKSNVFLGYTFTDAGGLVPGNDLKRHSISARVNSNVTEKLEIDAKLNYIRDDFSNVLSAGEGFDNPVRYLYKTPRNIRTEDFEHYEFINDEGKLRQHYFLPQFNGGGNPYWTINNVIRPRLDERVLAMLSVKYDITDDLAIFARSAMDRTSRSEEQIWYNDTYTQAPLGQYTKRASNSYDWNTDVLITYNKNLSEDFKIGLNAGANQRVYKRNELTGSGTNFTIENFFALSNTQNPVASEALDRFEVQSIYGLGEFSYKNAIFLNLTARNDWSSTLPESNRSYFYPSVGLTAVVSDLVDFGSGLSFLKLRANWAEVGNDTGSFRLSRRADIRNGTLDINPTQPNTNLRPESTQSLELGFDSRFFDNRLRFDVTYYKTNTFDQIFSTPTPVASGIANVFQNGANIENRGVEVVLGATIVNNDNFSWDLDLNFATNQNEVLEIAEGFDKLTVNSDFIRDYVLEVGGEYGDIYSRGFERDDQGRVIVDALGLPLITPGRDAVKVANFNPDWLGGIRNSFRYKNFNFSTLIDIRQGGSVTSFSEAILARDGVLDYTANGRDGGLIFGENIFSGETAVREDGSPNTISVSAEDYYNRVGGRNTPVGEAFVRELSNIRLREMVFGYTLPQKMLSDTFLTSANFSLVGRNLFFITNKAENFDPEIVNSVSNDSEGREAFALPTSRSVGVSINFGF
ncbi:TonB-linked outer membrane protein, SusC/RagA family [Pricia antarctica]|uniref:TonB-linked outer membrane protein, SusC/RagA family n=1 Tax=Pricia antarctica TaxID=641691 RepID=A0A1G7FDM6_9FLAO|nr:SusC/RagA family TonB-linked outer membrane protein [Pricia antarctica]SDE73655.1 TonB-linked outer membrane protein, SusC/RagA family [Pricia antarctica]